MSSSWLAYLEHKYRFIRRLGQGATATVYEIQDISTLQRFALKIVPIQNYADRKRVYQEIMMGMRIKHPNSVNFYESYELEYSQPSTYPEKKIFQIGIRMQIGVINLSDQIRRRSWMKNYFSKISINKFLYSMINCLCEMQKQGLLHGDLKPANIVKVKQSNGTYNYKICDFGCTTKYEESRERNITGSYLYVSPKIAVKFENPDMYVQPNNFKDDVYSLGVTALEMINLGYIQPEQGLAKAKSMYGEQIEMILRKILSKNQQDRPDFITLKKLVSSEIKLQVQDENPGSSTGKIQSRGFKRDKNYLKLKLMEKLKTKKKNEENIKCALFPSSNQFNRQKQPKTKKQLNRQEETRQIKFRQKSLNAGIFIIKSNPLVYAYSINKLSMYFNKEYFQIVNWTQDIQYIFPCHQKAMLLVLLKNNLIYFTFQEIRIALLKTLENDRRNQKKWGFKNIQYFHYIDFNTLKKARSYKISSSQNKITCFHQGQNNLFSGWSDGHVSIDESKFKVCSDKISHILEAENHLLIATKNDTIKKFQINKIQQDSLHLVFEDQIKIETPVINFQLINSDLVCILQNGFVRIFDGLSFEKSKVLRISQQQLVDGKVFSEGSNLISVIGLTSSGSIIKFTENSKDKEMIHQPQQSQLQSRKLFIRQQNGYTIFVLDSMGKISIHQIKN